MKRNLKALGLALVAAFAMSVVAASAAQAEKGLLTETNNEYPVAITGHEENDPNAFTLQGNATECSDVTFEGTIEEATTNLTITPHYTECVSGGVKSKVHLNGCDYTFTTGTLTAGHEVAHGSVHVICPEGKNIELTIPEAGTLCQVHIPGQAPEGEVTYTNNPALSGDEFDDVTVDVDVDVAVNVTKESIFCPLAAGVDTAIYESEVTVTGWEDLGIHENPNTPGKDTLTEGSQLDIHVGTEG